MYSKADNLNASFSERTEPSCSSQYSQTSSISRCATPKNSSYEKRSNLYEPFRVSSSSHPMKKVTFSSKEIVYSINLNNLTEKSQEYSNRSSFLPIIPGSNKLTSTPTPEYQGASILKLNRVHKNYNVLKKKKFVDLNEYTWQHSADFSYKYTHKVFDFCIFLNLFW